MTAPKTNSTTAASVTGQTIAVDGGQHLAWQTPDVHGIVE